MEVPVEIGEARGEILRLVAALRSHGRPEDDADPGPGPVARVAEFPPPNRALARAARLAASEPRPAPRGDGSRLRRTQELDQPRPAPKGDGNRLRHRDQELDEPHPAPRGDGSRLRRTQELDEPHPAPRGDGSRLRQREKELDDLRQLRLWIESRIGELKNSGASLERLEQAVKRLEEKLDGFVEASAAAPPQAHPRNRPASDRVRSSRPSYAFSGRIQGQMVADMLQTVSSNGMSGVFVVEIEDDVTELYFEQGRMCHAVSGDVVGERAFFTAFGADSGRYYFRETEELPPERTIDASTQLLILEALRQIDENSRE
jgi:hypothetical protein